MAMTATVLQDIRANYPSMLDKWELRPELYGLLNKGVANTTNPQGIISADVVAKTRGSWGRIVEIPVMSRASQANGTGLGCTFTGTESISDLVNATYVTISNGFEMQPAKNFQNQITYAQEFARKYADAIRPMAQAVNAAVDTSLTGVIENVYTSSYIGVGAKYGAIGANGAIQVSLANRPNFFNDLVDVVATDDIFPQLDVIGSTNLRGIVTQLFAQGQSNDVNTQYQFTQGDYNFMFDKGVTVGAIAPTDASAYYMPVGAFGILHKNSPDCIAGNPTTDGKRFGTLFDPTLGMTMDTLFYSECGDVSPESGNADDTTAIREYHQMAVHFAILTPYENLQSGVIRKFDLLTA
jgi:hypothetical protein